MKKFSALLLFVVMSISANASMKYECWAYQSGKPYKMVYVSADNKREAISLAWDKFKNLGVRAESVNCK